MSSRSKFRATRVVPVFPGTSELAFIPDREIFTVPTSPPVALTPSPFPAASWKAVCPHLLLVPLRRSARLCPLIKAETRAPASPRPKDIDDAAQQLRVRLEVITVRLAEDLPGLFLTAVRS